MEEVIAELGLKGDRVAVEFNGAIVPRMDWAETRLKTGFLRLKNPRRRK